MFSLSLSKVLWAEQWLRAVPKEMRLVEQKVLNGYQLKYFRKAIKFNDSKKIQWQAHSKTVGV